MGTALLQPFQPLWLSWGGRGEVRTLHRVEAAGPAPVLAGKVLICGFYLNELLVRLLGRDDPHESLFTHYRDALGRLVGDEDFEGVLRRFELQLLAEIGYALLLDREADSGLPVRRGRRYRYEPEHGPVALAPSEHEPFAIAGETLLRLAADQILVGQGAREARYLLRRVLACYLGDRPLKSRELFRRLHR
jgi:DNA repair protein RecO (recombination protein O)